VNLKSAARQLGVHYQTAYRWVRQGDLVAVKVGTTYEVSPAALEQFRARRLAARDYALEIDEAVTGEVDGADDLLDGLAAIAEQCGPSTVILEDEAVRALAERLDAGAILRLLDESGDHLTGTNFHHRDPRTRALLGRFFGVVPVWPSLAGETLCTGTPLRWTNIPQDQLRARLHPAAHQVLDHIRLTQLLQVRICAGDAPIGVLQVLRHDGRAFSDDDVATAVAVAELLGAARARAERFVRAWARRNRLVDDLQRALAEHGMDPAVECARRWIEHLDVGAAVTDQRADRRIVVAANEQAAEALGLRRHELVGRSALDIPQFLSDAAVAASVGRLRTGALDYASFTAATPDGGRRLDVHCGAVRQPDAAVAMIVTTITDGLEWSRCGAATATTDVDDVVPAQT
jgi:excisionase family DNA binding protein